MSYQDDRKLFAGDVEWVVARSVEECEKMERDNYGEPGIDYEPQEWREMAPDETLKIREVNAPVGVPEKIEEKTAAEWVAETSDGAGPVVIASDEW